MLFPVADGTEPVDETEAVLPVPEVGFVRLQNGVTGTLPAFLSAFPGKDQRPAVLEPWIVTERRGADIDFQVRRTPAYTEVGRGLREASPGGRLSLFPTDASRRTVGQFEMDRGRETPVPEHLPCEPAFFPLKEDGDPESFADLAAVIRSDFPVEKAGAASVYFLVPELDLLFRNAVVKEIE